MARSLTGLVAGDVSAIAVSRVRPAAVVTCVVHPSPPCEVKPARAGEVGTDPVEGRAVKVVGVAVIESSKTALGSARENYSVSP